VEGALLEVKDGKRLAEQMAAPYLEAKKAHEALESLLSAAERFGVAPTEGRRALLASCEAREASDWAGMTEASRRGREEVSRTLPPAIKTEIMEAKKRVTDAKLQGKDVSQSVRLLLEVGIAFKQGNYEAALYHLADLREVQQGA